MIYFLKITHCVLFAGKQLHILFDHEHYLAKENLKTGKTPNDLDIDVSVSKTIQTDHNNIFFLAACQDKNVRIYDVINGTLLATIGQNHTHDVTSVYGMQSFEDVKFNGSRFLTTCNDDRMLWMFDVSTLKTVACYKSDADVSSAVFLYLYKYMHI